MLPKPVWKGRLSDEHAAPPLRPASGQRGACRTPLAERVATSRSASEPPGSLGFARRSRFERCRRRSFLVRISAVLGAGRGGQRACRAGRRQARDQERRAVGHLERWLVAEVARTKRSAGAEQSLVVDLASARARRTLV